jgi:hypothetical protein
MESRSILWLAVIVAFLLFWGIRDLWLRVSSRRFEYELAARLEEVDARVPVVVAKLRSRGRVSLANRIAGAHKRGLFLDEFDEDVAKAYKKALLRRSGLARRIEAAYGKPNSVACFDSGLPTQGLVPNGSQ